MTPAAPDSDTRPLLRVMHMGNGIAMALVDTTCVVLWRGGATRARFDIQRAGLAQVAARYPGRTGFLCVVESTSEPPSEELRSAAGDMLKEHATALVGAACVIEGDGFRASIARAVLRSIELLMGRLPFPTRFFARVPEASAWIATRTHGSARPLMDAVETLRDKLAKADAA